MSARVSRVSRAACTAGLSLLLLALGGLPAAAQDADLCAVLTADDLAAVVPGSYGAPAGMAGSCQWAGTTDGGAGVIVIAYALPGSARDMPGAEVIDVGGHPAFSMSDPAMAVPSHVVGVETADGLLVLTVSVDDEAVDVAAVTAALAATAVARVESGVSSVAASPPPDGATSSSAPAPSSAAIAAGSVCELATPEEIAAAVGLDVELTVQDLEIACSWEALSGDEYVLMYAMRQEPIAFEALLSAVGAEEIDGPGEENWWAGDMASLFSRQGDLVLTVNYTSSTQPSEDDVKEKTLALMGALLAP